MTIKWVETFDLITRYKEQLILLHFFNIVLIVKKCKSILFEHKD